MIEKLSSNQFCTLMNRREEIKRRLKAKEEEAEKARMTDADQFMLMRNARVRKCVGWNMQY